MRFAYPATFEPEDGGYVVSFRDVPGANTEGDDEAEALAEAQDALVVALGHYVERRLPLPAPSRPDHPAASVEDFAAAAHSWRSACGMRRQGG